ncbi:Planctomycete cytochrome C [Polystyrenella longa]|uniref:Planctomycete cytochrome C n=1 Tax=Polystyrenella longa TaxID=2528007 RepID=A0A518CJI3_9PLAN|nr:PSD1 and planctomycete cytochrome C domain-containing protein [Polystyrenella longa]QDU79398.1 Planctomycete cytochrome C [Polystyrenella longa]
MLRHRGILSVLLLLVLSCAVKSAAADEKKVSFNKYVKPILMQRCAGCHSGAEPKGGFSLATRELLMQGGDSGPAIDEEKPATSNFLSRIHETDANLVMPPQGKPLDDEQKQILTQWLEEGVAWPEGFVFRSAKTAPLELQPVDVPNVTGLENPVDRVLFDYLNKHQVSINELVDDRVYARRVSLDLVGLLPSPEELELFVKDDSPDKKEKLVERLLADREAYADHWLTFWNDSLRNAYHGTGFIDDGRRQITGWLYKALFENKPYDEFVYELLSGSSGAEGFTRGIQWRGVVNASQRTEVQAAQNLGQVFLGINLKCASCHDSFISDWKLDDAWALSAVFATEPLEVHHCDTATGEFAEVGFLFPQLGTIDATVSREERMDQLANLVVKPENGRLARTIVNRLWSTLMGRGLIEPVHEMDRQPWHPELLEWLAADLVAHDYDLKRTLKIICNSRVYQMPSVAELPPEEEFVEFRGPVVKRLSAEQYLDAISVLIHQWQPAQSPEQTKDGRGQGGQYGAILAVLKENGEDKPADEIRASLSNRDPLMAALGRPNREQVVMQRDTFATTLQALELTNGETLDTLLKTGAEYWKANGPEEVDRLIREIYILSLSREPTEKELLIAQELIGPEKDSEGVQDLLWIIVMLPEFQLIR